MIDDAVGEFLDGGILLATCRTNPTRKEVYQLCDDTFKTLLKCQLENGHVPDNIFEELRFLQEEDLDGKHIWCEATISQELYQ